MSFRLVRDREFADSLLEGSGFELVWGFSCQVVVFGLLPVRGGMMNCDRGFLHSFGVYRACLLRSRGSLPLGRIFVPQTSHEGRDRQGSALMMWPAMWIGSRIAASANVSETSSRGLITRARVGSLGFRPGRSSLF